MHLIQGLIQSRVLSLPFGAFAERDPEKGEKVFRKCSSCHEVGPDAKDKTGPALNRILGAAAGASADFKYSKALQNAAEDGLVWGEASLTAFLTKPRDFLARTKMSFRGLRRKSDIANVIAFLGQK